MCDFHTTHTPQTRSSPWAPGLTLWELFWGSGTSRAPTEAEPSLRPWRAPGLRNGRNRFKMCLSKAYFKGKNKNKTKTQHPSGAPQDPSAPVGVRPARGRLRRSQGCRCCSWEQPRGQQQWPQSSQHQHYSRSMCWEEQQSLPNSFLGPTMSPAPQRKKTSLAAEEPQPPPAPGPAPALLRAAPGRQPRSLPLLTPRTGPSHKKTCPQQTRDKEEEAGDRGPDAGFFCTSVFLTPQPVAAYNKTEIRKSNQNTHPKAKNPRLKQGAAWPPGGEAGGWESKGKG